MVLDGRQNHILGQPSKGSLCAEQNLSVCVCVFCLCVVLPAHMFFTLEKKKDININYLHATVDKLLGKK